MQLAARTPANCAMSAATVDALAGGGRFIAGLGVSGPQIVEGWYGQPWGKPYWRIKDYVEIMRKMFAREAPVAHEGREISLPYTGPGAMGVGKPLKSILHMRPDIPIYLGTGNEATVKLTAEIADGWLPLGFVPGSMPEYRPWLEEGFRRAGKGKGFAQLRDPGLGPRGGRHRRQGGARQAEARGRALRRRHGPPRQELSQGHPDPPRLRRGCRAHPGALPRPPQGGGDRRRARRVGRLESRWSARPRASSSASAPGRTRAPPPSPSAPRTRRPSR